MRNGRRRRSQYISIRKLQPLRTTVIDNSRNEEQGQSLSQQPLQEASTMPTVSFRNRLLNALEEAYEAARSKTKNVAIQNIARPKSVPHAVPLQLMSSNSEHSEGVPTVSDTPIMRPSNLSTLEELEAARQARIQARRRKLGPLVKSINYPYPRRHIQRIVLADSEKISNTVRRIVEKKLQSRGKENLIKPRAKGIVLSNFEGAQSSLKSTVNAEEEVTKSADVQPKAVLLSTPPTDYHFRQMTPVRKYKFTQKLRRQPRLRLRISGEKGNSIRGNQTSSAKRPLDLPNLAPLSSGSDSLMDIKIPTGEGSSIGSDTAAEVGVDTSRSELSAFGSNTATSGFVGDSGVFGGGSGKPPPVDFGEMNLGVFGSGGATAPPDDVLTSESPSTVMTPETTTSPLPFVAPIETPAELIIPKNSGLRPASPPPEFEGGFGTGITGSPFRGTFQGSGVVAPEPAWEKTDDTIQPSGSQNRIEESIFTGESALTPNRAGPTGDGLGPPILPGAAVPPPVPALSIGGAAAGIPPYTVFQTTENPPTTLKPSALLSVLNKADVGFNQAISHFEQGTPVESAAIDILEVALGSEKLDSQAKLLGHIDRTIGIDNLQRLQRWANTGGALDALKEQLVKIAKNYSPPENLLPTLPPQLQYLFSPSSRIR